MTSNDWTYLPLTDLSYQILLVVGHEPLHGYGILQAISARTNGRIEPDTGTLYTAIRRLKRDELLKPSGADGPKHRGRRYALTALGRRILRLESIRLAGLVSEAKELNLIPQET